MTNALVDIALAGAFLIFTARLFRRQPVAAPDSLPDVPSAPALRERRPALAASRAAREVPAIHAPTPDARPDYLLGGRGADGREDNVAAMLGMMSGPGICTPRE